MYLHIDDEIPHRQQISRGLFIANALRKSVSLVFGRSTFPIDPGSSLKENLDRWKKIEPTETAETVEIPDFEDIRYSLVYSVLAGNTTLEAVWMSLNRNPMPEILGICVGNGWLSFDDETETLSVPMEGLVFLEDYFDWEISTKRRHPNDGDQLLLDEYIKRFKAGEKVPPINEFNMKGRKDLLDAMAADRRVWLVFKQYPHLFGFKGRGKAVKRNPKKRHEEWTKLLTEGYEKKHGSKKTTK